MASERRMISRSPMGLVRCSADWRIFADRRIVQRCRRAVKPQTVKEGEGRLGESSRGREDPSDPRSDRFTSVLRVEWGGHVLPVTIGVPIVSLAATNG
jgi:hypothetical protein